MTSSDVLEVSVHIGASPETVFGFLIDPTKYTQWMGSEATIEAVPGGVYRVHMRDGVEAVGQFVEVDPPKRVVFTWGWQGDEVVGPGATRVEITLSPVGASATDVVLRHYGLPGAEQLEHHRQGWDLYLGRLTVAAEGGDPGSDPNA